MVGTRGTNQQTQQSNVLNFLAKILFGQSAQLYETFFISEDFCALSSIFAPCAKNVALDVKSGFCGSALANLFFFRLMWSAADEQKITAL